MAIPFHKESILKTVKTLFILVSVVLIGIGLGGCDEAQQMVPPTVEGGGEDTTTTPPVEPPTVVPEGPVVSIMPASVTSPAVGEQLKVEIQVAGVENVFGYEFTLMFDAAALRYVESANGDYLSGAFFAPPMLKNDNQIALSAGAGAASEAENGTLASVTFEVISRKASTLTLADVLMDYGGSTSEPQAVNAEISE